MNDGFKKIYWGLIFLIFHINLGVIQILPAFVAYIIIYYGIEKVIEKYDIDSLNKCAKYCSVLAFMSFIFLVVPSAISEEVFKNIVFSLIWTNISMAVELVMIYRLFEGIIEILKEKDENTSFQYSNKIGRYIVLSAIYIMANNINTVISSEAIGIAIVVLALSLRIWVIVLIRRLNRVELLAG